MIRLFASRSIAATEKRWDASLPPWMFATWRGASLRAGEKCRTLSDLTDKGRCQLGHDVFHFTPTLAWHRTRRKSAEQRQAEAFDLMLKRHYASVNPRPDA
jgi:hypothetical protein